MKIVKLTFVPGGGFPSGIGHMRKIVPDFLGEPKVVESDAIKIVVEVEQIYQGDVVGGFNSHGWILKSEEIKEEA
ncbi:MAG: hypothetical protein ISS87_00055 [Candidatus Pacebacteria bacterium]|nr:hypothetical protein [Candidatus Paceibacterota bacterium]